MDPTVFLPCPVSGCAAQLRPCVATSMFFVRRGSPTGPRAAYRVLHVDYVAKTMTLSEEEIEDGTTCAVAEHYFDERDGHNVASLVRCGTCGKEPSNVCLPCKPPNVEKHYFCLEHRGITIGTAYERGAGAKKNNLRKHLMSDHCESDHYSCVICVLPREGRAVGYSTTKEDAQTHFTAYHRTVDTLTAENDFRTWNIKFLNGDRVLFGHTTEDPQGRIFDWPIRITQDSRSTRGRQSRRQRDKGNRRITDTVEDSSESIESDLTENREERGGRRQRRPRQVLKPAPNPSATTRKRHSRVKRESEEESQAGPSSAPPDYDRETLFLGMDSIATSYIEGAQSFGPFEPDPPSFSPLITIRRPERPSADSPLLPPLVTSFSWSTVGQSRETDDEGMQLSISSAYEEMREEEDEEEAERDE